MTEDKKMDETLEAIISDLPSHEQQQYRDAERAERFKAAIQAQELAKLSHKLYQPDPARMSEVQYASWVADELAKAERRNRG
jgi:hypothetical protein